MKKIVFIVLIINSISVLNSRIIDDKKIKQQLILTKIIKLWKIRDYLKQW